MEMKSHGAFHQESVTQEKSCFRETNSADVLNSEMRNQETSEEIAGIT